MNFSNLATFSLFLLVSSEICIDKKHNVFRLTSTLTPLPVHLKDLTIHIYDEDDQPSCLHGEANIVTPGVFRFASGSLFTDRHYDILKSGLVKITAEREGQPLCRKGHSAIPMVLEEYCRFELVTLIPEDVTRILQSKGHHSIEELEQKIHFNRTVELPEGPSFMGVQLLDILGVPFSYNCNQIVQGKFRVVALIESNGQPVVEFSTSGSTEFQLHA